VPARTRARRRSPAPVSESLERLGERIRKARTESGLSQSQLGDPHFTRAYVSALELGKIRPAMKSLEFLAAKLGKPVSYFVEDEKQERKRHERQLILARAGQLISQGAARDALAELNAIPDDGMTIDDRLTVKRTLARAYLEAGEPGKSSATLVETLRGYEALGNAEQIARTRGQLGAALVALMSHAEAEEHLAAALRATASGVVRDPLFRVHVLHNLGVCHYQRAAYGTALEHFERAAEEGRDIADQKWLASLYAAMGMSRRQVGDFESAVSWLRKSETLFDSINNQSSLAEIRFQMARTLREIGNKRRAAELLTEAAQTATSAGNQVSAIKIEAFAALAQAQDGDYDGAIQRLQKLVPIAAATENPRLMFVATFSLAKSLTDVQPARSEAILRELMQSLEKSGSSPELAAVYDELGRALSGQGRTEEAITYAQRAYAARSTSKRGG
jgi:tetratricopeptide (TPR) repeat protein